MGLLFSVEFSLLPDQVLLSGVQLLDGVVELLLQMFVLQRPENYKRRRLGPNLATEVSKLRVSITQWLPYLFPDPTATGSILSIPIIYSKNL